VLVPTLDHSKVDYRSNWMKQLALAITIGNIYIRIGTGLSLGFAVLTICYHHICLWMLLVGIFAQLAVQ